MKSPPDADGHRNSETFVLRNDPPPVKPREFQSKGGKQRVMFSGMNLCAGQRDLFETDGYLSEGDDELHAK